jgi:uncharacterized protein
MSSDSMAVASVIAPVRTRAVRRVFLSARWQALAMLNWEMEPAVIEPLVPRGCELDFHAGRTFVSVVGFLFLDTRLLGLPVPGHRSFEEVNLRFYVRRACEGESRRGVAFVKEIVPRWAIAQTARLYYNEPYVALPMRHEVMGTAAELVGGFRAPRHASRGIFQGSGFSGEGPGDRGQKTGDREGGRVMYGWRMGRKWNAIELEYEGPRMTLAPGSHEEFIAEHYFGYCGQSDGGTVEYQVEHPPWKIWQAVSAKLDADVAALYGPQFEQVLSRPPTSAFLADGSAVAVLWPTRISM